MFWLANLALIKMFFSLNFDLIKNGFWKSIYTKRSILAKGIGKGPFFGGVKICTI
jgi:hypothetical protein